MVTVGGTDVARRRMTVPVGHVNYVKVTEGSDETTGIIDTLGGANRPVSPAISSATHQHSPYEEGYHLG